MNAVVVGVIVIVVIIGFGIWHTISNLSDKEKQESGLWIKK